MGGARRRRPGWGWLIPRVPYPCLIPQGIQTAVLAARPRIKETCARMSSNRAAVSACMRRLTGLAPWGARSSSLPFHNNNSSRICHLQKAWARRRAPGGRLGCAVRARVQPRPTGVQLTAWPGRHPCTHRTSRRGAVRGGVGGVCQEQTRWAWARRCAPEGRPGAHLGMPAAAAKAHLTALPRSHITHTPAATGVCYSSR